MATKLPIREAPLDLELLAKASQEARKRIASWPEWKRQLVEDLTCIRCNT